jgi:dipeptidyl aminopeptidase/acylaminoacyl peptidase
MIRKILLGLVLATPSLALAADPPGKAAAMFGVRESVSHIGLSPDGRRIVYIAPGPGRESMAMVGDLTDGSRKMVAASTGKPERLQWCEFASNTRLVCRFSAIVQGDGQLIPMGRLVTLSAEGGELKLLGQQKSTYDAGLRQFDGAILDWLPGEDGAVLMAREYMPEHGKLGTVLIRTQQGLGVDRIDLKTLKSSRVEAPSPRASAYISDGRGNVRIMRTDRDRGDNELLTGESVYTYRKAGSSRWEKFSDDVLPIAVDATTDSAYALKKLDGRYALYRVKLDGTLATELVYANPRVDIDDVVRLGRGDRVIGATYAEEQRKTVYFDPEYKKLAASLSKAIPNLPLITFIGASADDKKLLIFAGSDSDPGRYYLFDKGTKALGELMLARPELEKTTLAAVKPVSYPVGNVTIPGYLTLPPGREAKGLPAIVLPHGGPTARDEWGFDWLAQFLASRGFAVLQPNYRGSAGFGDAWLNENGFKGWRTSIGDVTAGAKWMVAQGIADPKRLAIVGWSYGGYAALQAAVLDPELFRAVVAIAPVSDLELLKKEAEGYTNAKVVAAFVGTGPHITEGSPLQNARRISAPVLMFHGDRDLNVDIEHARKMHKALQSAGKDSELVAFPDLEHSLVDSQVRARMLEKIAIFLEAKVAK